MHRKDKSIMSRARALVLIPLAIALAAVFGLVATIATANAATGHARPVYRYAAASVRPLAPVHTATTYLALRPDSGNHGTWALDDFARTITLTRHTAVSPSLCGPQATQCFYYTYVIKDSGIYTVLAGAASPRAGTPEDLTERGMFSGGTTTGFLFASWKRAYTSGVPVLENDNGVIPVGLHTTTSWVQQFFGRTVRIGASSLGVWGWTYFSGPGSDSQCPAANWKWADTAANGAGSLSTDGDILAPDAADCKAQTP